MAKKAKKGGGKVGKAMHEYKHGELHSGSKTGPEVHSKKQALAIGLSEARKAGERVPAKKGARSRERRLAHARM